VRPDLGRGFSTAGKQRIQRASGRSLLRKA
jgi:hypothetical protein